MPAPHYIQTHAQGVAVCLHVQPKARASAMAGEHDGRLKLKIASPPVDGKANAEVCRFLAELLGVPKSAVTIAQGASSRSKLAVVRQVTVEEAARRLAAAGGSDA
jgi:hypothetical protein